VSVARAAAAARRDGVALPGKTIAELRELADSCDVPTGLFDAEAALR
jgi:hypothetical protein